MELEPIITAGAAVAFSVAGYLMSNQRSKPKATLRTTRSESDLKKMGADAVLSKYSGAAMEAAAALHNSEGSKPAVPTNSPRGFRRGLNIISIDNTHSNVLQRTSIALPFLPTLLEEPKELDEDQEKENIEESEPGTKVETEKGINLEETKDIECDQMLSDKLLKRDEESTFDESNSLFLIEIKQPETKNEMEVAHVLDHNLLKTKEETKSNKPYSLLPSKAGQLKREPKTDLEQVKTSAKVRDRAIEWAHTVRDLLDEDDSDEEERLHILPQTLLEAKEEPICIRRPQYTAPRVAQEESDDFKEENEIERLHALAETLLEKERDLEVQMLELYGLKEQQEAIKQMENLSKINSTKAKFLSLKVESLEEENVKLKNKILELEKVTDKIDKNKEKINMLKKRLRSEDDNAKEKIALLRESIETLADKEDKSAADYEEMERKLERVKELEDEVNELKRLNARLEAENSGLAHQLENVQSVASSPMKSPEEQVLEEATSLRETNEKLKQEIAELKDNHYLSVEEVVYLRWLNACLRHELENSNPSKGKGVASELNKSPSYHSTEKVKQLLQDYSNLGINIDETKLMDFDFGYSSSQTPSAFASPMHEQSKHPKNKTNKFLGKLRKMVMGKGSSHADKDKDKDRKSLSSELASVSHSDESSPSSSIRTVERFPQPEKRVSLNIVRPKSIEPATARSNSDLGLLDVRRGEPRRYHALHLGHSSVEIDDREREEIMRNVLDLKSLKPTSKSSLSVNMDSVFNFAPTGEK